MIFSDIDYFAFQISFRFFSARSSRRLHSFRILILSAFSPLLGTGVKSTRRVRSRLETVCPMGSGARGVLVLHSDISDFLFIFSTLINQNEVSAKSDDVYHPSQTMTCLGFDTA